MALISCAVTAQLICAFVFASASCRFSDAVAQLTVSACPSVPSIKSSVRAVLWNNQSGWWGTFTEIYNI